MEVRDPMLLSFRVANHRSLRTEQQLLLTPTYAADEPDDASWEALPVAGIFGANASGKSNVIDALEYMSDMVRGSFRENEPEGGIERHPFALDPAMLEEPSTYVVDVIIGDVRYTYGFVLDDVRIIEEWMYSYPLQRKRIVFHRREDEYEYGEHSPKELRQVEQLTEPNVLFLSVGVRTKQRLLLPVYEWFRNLEWRTTPQTPIPNWMYGRTARIDADYLRRIVVLLRAADTGIEDAQLVDESEEEYAERVSRLPARVRNVERPRRKYLSFQHRGVDGNAATLSLREQSTGTQSLYMLALPAFLALDRGTPFLVDELDSSLHSFLTAQLIKLFREPETNPRGAQLIFTSHDVSLLGRIQGEEVLQRDHIWFTQKDECGATELFPVSDFNPRKDENRERRYLAGRYGAVPLVNDELFVEALAAREDSGDADRLF
ncbi:AAA family ATPase [Actinomadura algeriensis]|uniref:AAA15 family ATPase/GTPase n=1 Tax=Actinomadura algeriensis TaxID=1679523 RepID=A0ABR9JK00_9ACTN|nr:ATP-binding protein [Actinomadura algeriensis]MBE1530888.1 AAA15 family ATPase/GTPase [Actinomadura algeriensis]